MIFFDIHSHGRPQPKTLVSLTYTEYQHSKLDNFCASMENGFLSLGIHPWDVSSVSSCMLDNLRKLAFEEKNAGRIIAIGEAGIDRLKNKTALEKQINIFAQQIEIAEELSLPLVIHSVRSLSEILALRKRHRKNIWLIHGFLGNEYEIRQCLKYEVRLSPALALLHYHGNNVEAHNLYKNLKKIPPDFLFMETDATGIDIKQIYQWSAQAQKISLFALQEIVLKNFSRDFKVEIDSKIISKSV